MQPLINLANPQAYVWLALFTIYGLVIGSFLNVCIYRLPQKISVAAGRSFCPACNHQLKAIDLLPLFSFLFLKGKCRYCGNKISWQYPIVEALTGLIFALAFLRFQLSFYTVLVCLLGAVLLVITCIDWQIQQIPDSLQVAILVLALTNLLVPNNEINLPIYHKIIGFFIISLPMLLLAYFTNGFGGGDIKLVAVAGLFLGTYQIVLAFFIATLLGGIYGAYLLICQKRGGKTPFAFGPFLSLGIFISCLYGSQIIQAYAGLFA